MLNLNELVIFKHGMDGLHIWEAGIILARYVAINHNKFLKKNILELGSGVGIGGLSSLLFTDCLKVTFSDYNKEIVKNIEKNIVKH